MKLIVIGRAEEVLGLTLAGVRTIACDAADEAPAVVEQAATAGGAGLVLVSPWIARHAERAVDAARRRKGPPVVAVIPG